MKYKVTELRTGYQLYKKERIKEKLRKQGRLYRGGLSMKKHKIIEKRRLYPTGFDTSGRLIE